MNSFGCNNKSKKFTTSYPQEGLGWVHVQLVCPHDVEHSFHVYEVIAFVATFHSDIIDIAFYGLTYMLMEDRIHGALIGCTSVLQAEGHHYVAVYPQRHPEGCVLFIFRVHLYLIIPSEAIHKRHRLKTARIVDHDVCDRERKFVFRMVAFRSQ